MQSLRTQVLLGPLLEDITDAVTGRITVSVSTESPVRTAQIPVASERLPYYVTGSWSRGPLPVVIRVGRRTEAGTTWTTLFSGTTEIPENAGVIIPSGALRAVSDAAAWANTPGCVLIGPLQGYTRVDILGMLATAAGVTLTVSGSHTSTVVKKAVDLSDVTAIDLLKRWGPLDGCVGREADDGSLELLDFADVCGPAAAAAVGALTPDSYFAPREQPPSRPATDYVVSGTEVVVPADDTYVTTIPDAVGNGSVVLTRTITNGVMSQEIRERYDDYAPLGTGVNPTTNQVIERVTTDFTHDTNGGGEPTGRLLSKTTVIERMYCPFADQGTSPYFTFTDGSFRTATDETLMEVERVEETYTWDTTGCFLATGHVETQKWLAPISEAAYSDPTYTWPDGSVRSQHEETYQVTSDEKWEEYIAGPQSAYNPGLATRFGTGSFSARWRGRLEGSLRHSSRLNSEQAIAWIEGADGASHNKLTRTITSNDQLALFGLGAYTGQIVEEWAREDGEGPMPMPPVVSESARTYAQRAWTASASATGTAWPSVATNQFDKDAENKAEGERAAKWAMRLAFAVPLTIDHDGEPTWKPWDVVTVTDPVREYDTRQGWIDSIQWSIDPHNGVLDQQTVVKVDPLPEVAP